jgi:hydrogenase expression/formation protein HypC
MCLAIPAEVVTLKENHKAVVNIGGIHKEISLILLSDIVKTGDFVIIHVGFALTKLNQTEAIQTLQDYKQMLGEGVGK